MRRRLDRVLVAGVVLLIAVAAVDAVRPHARTHPRFALRGIPSEPAHAVSLHRSPDVAFLRECEPERVRLSLTPTEVDVHYVGPPCRLADALRTTVRSAGGKILYRGTAARVAANVAGRTVVRRELLPTLPRCTSSAPYSVVVVAFGHTAHGSLSCGLDYSEQ